MASSAIVLGTRNPKKRRELEKLLGPLGIELMTLDQFPDSIEVDETGTTFGENACLKAVEQARRINHWVLAEDSGLVVEALDGAPGVYSARFAGPDATDATNNQLLLERLGHLPLDKRSAYYVCHMALADPHGDVRLQSEATCHGRILSAPRGTSGFGYDPLFEVREYHQTFAELGETVKSVLSHRARAMQSCVAQLQRVLAEASSPP